MGLLRVLAIIFSLLGRPGYGQVPRPFTPNIPTTWVDSEIADLEIPLAEPSSRPNT